MLTGIVLANNEEKNITKCLKSLECCDSIYVIDDSSSDETVNISKKLGAKVITSSLANDFSAQRNNAISKIDSDWYLFIDADEVVSPELALQIKSVTDDSHKSKFNCYLLPRKEYVFGKLLQYGDLYKFKLIRLMKKNSGKWVGRVHERWEPKDPSQTGSLAGEIIHNSHEDLVSFLRHINYYSTIKSEEFFKQNKKINMLHVIFGPIYKFVNLYIFKFGILDKTAGFIHAMLMAFYVFLVASKTWQIQNKQPK